MRSVKPSPSPRFLRLAKLFGMSRSNRSLLAVPLASWVLAVPSAAQGNWSQEDLDSDGLPDEFERH